MAHGEDGEAADQYGDKLGDAAGEEKRSFVGDQLLASWAGDMESRYQHPLPGMASEVLS